MADRVEERPGDKAGMAGWVRQQWDRGDLALSRERRDFWLNYAFFEGEQWTYWHPNTREVAEFPRGRNDDRVRLTVNVIQPNLITLLAKLTQTAIHYEVPPSGSDDATLAGARLAAHLLTSKHADKGWERIRLDAIVGAFFGGTSAVVCEWDPSAGEYLGTDDDTGRRVHEGDVQLSALSVTEFTLEPGTRDQRDARWFIMAKSMTPEQVQEHYGLEDRPTADTQMASGPLQRKLWNDRGFPSNVELTTVYTYYERPSKSNAKGRYVVVVGDETIVDEPWPFPCKDRLNLYVFRQQQLPKRWTGATLLNDARPLQVAYNHACSMLSEHMKLAGNARLAIPDNSGVNGDDLSDEPGQWFYFDGMSSQPPRYLDPPNLPRWLVEHKNTLKDSLDDIMSVHDISRGVAPGDRNSGLALSVLAEKDETPLGLMAHDQAEGWGYIGSFCLKLWAEKVKEFRSAAVQTDYGVPLVRKWTGRHLAGQTTATVPLDATAPKSRAAMQAWLVELGQTFPGLLPQNPVMLARMFDLPNASMFGEFIDADVSQAESENHLMAVGIVPGLDDKPYPMPWDDHAKHIAEHNRFRKSQAYINSPSDVRKIVDDHLAAHEKLALEETLEQRELNMIEPGAAAVPQADEPAGSAVPQDYMERVQQSPAEMASAAGMISAA